MAPVIVSALVVHLFPLAIAWKSWIDFFAKEGGGGTSGDAYTDSLADVVVAFVEDHHLVLLGATAELLTASLAIVFHKDIKLLAFIKLIVGSGEFILQCNHLIEASYLCFLRHIIRQML